MDVPINPRDLGFGYTKDVTVVTPTKFKHCHGDTDNMRKAAKMQNYFRRHFVDILNRPRETSMMQTVAKKIKSLFKFGSKKK